MQLLSVTDPIEHCAVSAWPSGGHPTQTDRRFGDKIDLKFSAEYPQIKPQAHCVCAACSGTPLSTVQLGMFNGSSNVQVTKHAGSVSCSECLLMVTDIIFINIMVFGLGLGLCLSNTHTIFLLIPHFRSLNITIDFYIVFPSDLLSIFSTNVSYFSYSLPFLPSIKSP